MKRTNSFVLFLSLFSCSVIFAQSYLGVTTNNVNLRSGSGTDSEVIKILEPGTQLFLYSLETENDFYNVIIIETSEEGYVHKDYTKILQEVERSEDSIFTPVEESDSYNPTVEIFNNTDRTLTLKLNDERYTFYSNERRTLELEPGKYDFVASAPQVIPYYGSDKLVNNYSYSWEFYIVTE